MTEAAAACNTKGEDLCHFVASSRMPASNCKNGMANNKVDTSAGALHPVPSSHPARSAKPWQPSQIGSVGWPAGLGEGQAAAFPGAVLRHVGSHNWNHGRRRLADHCQPKTTSKPAICACLRLPYLPARVQQTMTRGAGNLGEGNEGGLGAL